MFFILSKILGALLMPFNLALLALTCAMLALLRRRFALARVLGAAAWVILVAFALLPLGQGMLRGLEDRYAVPDPMPRRVAGIIVLGGALDAETGLTRGAPQINDSAERVGALAALGRRYPLAAIVYTGGIGTLSQQGVPEAGMVRKALEAYGFYPGPRLMLEDKSRTTAENAAATLAALKPRPGQVWILVTSAWHMPRAMGAFRAAGWNGLVPYPVDYRTAPAQIDWRAAPLQNLTLAQLAIREYLGIVAYRLAGKWLPENN
ncbi:MAG: YdcF family protein [Rhodospirillales bacterium]|nr:YdcF family protein [Alphaproteobacteria bacterium]MCB9987615.1 YdcF family protein [Rhodospirillales bacterium]USO07670.1 MAG: YdcF family protein [Rhodospirillales bacterium]